MWAARESARAMGPSSSFNGLYRRIVKLPSSIIGSVSRAMTLMGVGGGRRHHQMLHRHDHDPTAIIIERKRYPEQEEELAFLRSFEQQYGIAHPFFYACPFAQALKMGEEESRLVFLYLHSPNHPNTAAFCRDTLCTELAVQFLDANFISWAAMADRGEGLQLAALLKAASFPFCAIVAPATGSNMAVLQQMEGPISPAELVEILQRTIEEHELALRTASREREIKIANRQLREEQDAAYLAALQLDKEKDRIRRESSMNEPQHKQKQKQKANHEKPNKHPPPPPPPPPPLTKTMQSGGCRVKETTKETQKPTTLGKDKQHSGLTGHSKIQIRFPSGERREQSFLPTDKIESIYRYIDSLDLPGIGSYRLISNFPRKVYGFEQLGMTLREAGLHPSASFFIEPVE